MGLLGTFIFLMGFSRPLARLCYGRGHYRYSMEFMVLGGTVLAGFLAMTSAVFAGIRRATGITVKRQNQWPLDVKRTEKWLQWYDSRLARINDKAEEKIMWAINKYGEEIDDPAVRQVWERQLRDDVMEKVARLRERRTQCEIQLRQAREIEADPRLAQRNRGHPPLLAGYLYVGEWLFDTMLAWARTHPHFGYESMASNDIPGSVSYEDLLGDAPPFGSQVDARPVSPNLSLPNLLPPNLLASRGDERNNAIPEPSTPLRSFPAPYIATALLQQRWQQYAELVQASAPPLSESQFRSLVHSAPSAPQFPPISEAPGTSPQHQQHTPLGDATTWDPPPYTPTDRDEDEPTQHNSSSTRGSRSEHKTPPITMANHTD
ncbi:hypothetical protein GGI26_004233 [Coemansia sp. RSA 1358]|nr:hypothetical protein EDC05_006472 [Coemansia umbellata]KAJ2621259.1 hypothetical protein GGI26_004233 [Coemansia sp. RSA 1358]